MVEDQYPHHHLDLRLPFRQEDMITDEAQGQQLPEVRRVEVNPEELAQYTTEHQFNGLAVDLMIECGSWVCIAACLLCNCKSPD